MVDTADTQKKHVHTRYNPILLQASAGSREHRCVFSRRKHSTDLGSKVRNGRGDSTCSARISQSCLQSDRSDRDLQRDPPLPATEGMLSAAPWTESVLSGSLLSLGWALYAARFTSDLWLWSLPAGPSWSGFPRFSFVSSFLFHVLRPLLALSPHCWLC